MYTSWKSLSIDALEDRSERSHIGPYDNREIVLLFSDAHNELVPPVGHDEARTEEKRRWPETASRQIALRA